MRTLTRLIATVALTFAVALTALAGETLTPPCAQPGEVLTPPCAAVQDTDAGESTTVQPVNSTSESTTDFLVKSVTTDLLEIAFSLF
jgi:hypothetical protein